MCECVCVCVCVCVHVCVHACVCVCGNVEQVYIICYPHRSGGVRTLYIS